MTYIYQWNGWPKVVNVICPQCGSNATFANPKQIIELKRSKTTPPIKVYTDRHEGYLSCLSCGLTKHHEINWPIDAYFKIEVKGNVLWAWDREHVVAIRNYIESKDRVRKPSKYLASLYHIPAVFKLAKNREACVKSLNDLLQYS
jgi:hypothetical protein